MCVCECMCKRDVREKDREKDKQMLKLTIKIFQETEMWPEDYSIDYLRIVMGKNKWAFSLKFLVVIFFKKWSDVASLTVGYFWGKGTIHFEDKRENLVWIGSR